MSTLAAVSTSWFSTDRYLLRNGTLVGGLRFAFLGTGTIYLDGEQYDIIKETFWTRILRLQHGRDFLCETRIQRVWGRRADFEFEGVPYTLTWPSFGTAPTLTSPGEDPTDFRRSGIFKRSVEADFLHTTPPVICAFALWLDILNRRNRSST